MQPSIFGKKLDDVEFADVVAFCAPQPKEGLGLDYKKDLSSLTNVVKTLVSFANTNGGWLIVGVEDDGNDAPKLPVTGMGYADNFVQRINNSIVASVSPIVLPFYKECLSPDGKKAFLIAYMPQSQAAPHFMQYKNRNTLFIRVADRASGHDWEQYAPSSHWEMLRNRRQGSVDLRGQLVDVMEDAYEAQARAEEHEKSMQRLMSSSPLSAVSALHTTDYVDVHRHYRRAQVIKILPEYPTEQVTDIATVKHMITNEPVRNGITNRRPQTPDDRGYDAKIYQSGTYTFHADSATDRYYFFGVDVYGNIMNVDPIELSKSVTDEDGDKQRQHFTELSLIVMSIVGALKFANNLYSKTGLVGNLVFDVQFRGSENCLMYFPMTSPAWPFNTDNLPQNATGYYSIRRIIDTTVLSDTGARDEFVTGVVKEVLYSFNYDTIDNDTLVALIKQADGPRG